MSQEELRDINAKPRPRIKLKEGSCHPIEKIRNFKSVPKSNHKKPRNNFTQDREDILLSFHHKNDKESQALDTLRYLNEEDTWDHSLEIDNHLKTAAVSGVTHNPTKNPKNSLQKSHSTSCFKLPASPGRAKRTYKLPMISVLKDTFSVSEENLSASLPRRLQGVTTYRNASPSEKASKIQDVKEIRDTYLYGRAYCGMLALGTIKSTENKEAATEKLPLSDRMKESLEENTTEEGEDPDRLAYQTREATSLENFEPSVREFSPNFTPKDAPEKKLEESGAFEPLGNVGKGTFFRVTFSGTNGFKKTVRENNEGKTEKDPKSALKPDHNLFNDLIQKSWHDKELFRKLLQKHSDEDLLQLKLKLLKETEPPKKVQKPKKERSQSRALTARMPVLAIDLKENLTATAEADNSSNNDLKEAKIKTDRRESKSIDKSPHVLNMQRYASVSGILPTRRQSEKIEKKTLYERTQDKVAMKGYNIFKLSTLQVAVPSNIQTLNPTPQSARPLNEDLAVKAPKAQNVRGLSFKVKQNDRPSMASISQTQREYNNQDSSYGIQRLRKMSPATPTSYLSAPKERSRDIKSFLTTRAVQEEQETLAVKEVSDLKRQSPLIMTSSGSLYEKGGTISKVIEQLKNEKVPMPKLSIRKIQL